MLVAAAVALVLATAAACSGPAGSFDPIGARGKWPTSPEPLPDAMSAIGDVRVTCGGPPFALAGLDMPAGAENEAGPEFDALRRTLVDFGPSFPGSSTWTWRLASRDATHATFLARTDALGPPGWVVIEVAGDSAGWKPGSMGQCDPHVVLSDVFGPARWAPDPAFPPPAPETTELHVLVWERACSGGSPTTGRMSTPVIAYGATSVTVTIGVRPLHEPDGTLLTCPGPPGTPASFRLREPLGDRQLLDGGHVPPTDPVSDPPFG